jgi:protein-S-isoprenylcysteine O-methyltransferase Ste14
MHSFSRAFIIVCWATAAVVWIVAAFGAKRTVEKRRWGWKRMALLLAVLVALVLLRRTGLPLPDTRRSLWPYTPLVAVIADLLTLAGLVVTLWARVTLGGNWSGSVVLKEDHELVQHGPYRYVRHPIYSGLLLMVLGFVIFAGRLSTVVGFLVLFVGFWIKSRDEEQLLMDHFPRAYAEYRKRTRALVPFLL